MDVEGGKKEANVIRIIDDPCPESGNGIRYYSLGAADDLRKRSR